MSRRPQIHIFVGAPSIPSPLEGLERSGSGAAAESWRELRCLCHAHGLVSGKFCSAAVSPVPQGGRSLLTGAPASGAAVPPVPQAQSSLLTGASASGAAVPPVPQAQSSLLTGAPASAAAVPPVPQAQSSLLTGAPASGAAVPPVPQAQSSLLTGTSASGAAVPPVPQAQSSLLTGTPASGAAVSPVPQAQSSLLTGASASGAAVPPVPQAQSSLLTGASASGAAVPPVPQAGRSLLTGVPASGAAVPPVPQAQSSLLTGVPASGAAVPPVPQAGRSLLTGVPASGAAVPSVPQAQSSLLTGVPSGAAVPPVPQAGRSLLTGTPASRASAQQGRLVVKVGKDGTSPALVAVTCSSRPKKSTSLTGSDCAVPKDRSTPAEVNQAAGQHLPQSWAESAGQEKASRACCPALRERKASPSEVSSSDIYALLASTEGVSIHLRSAGPQAGHRSERHERLSQCMDVLLQKSQESKATEANDCADFAVSADTEFRSVVTSSQVAVFAQNETRGRSETEAGKTAEERQRDPFQCDSGVGTCTTNVTENEYMEEHANSLELFSSEDDGENVWIKATKQEESAQENAEEFEELNVPAEQFVNEVRIEPLSSGILCSQGNCSSKNSSKRPRKYEDSFHLFHSAFKRQLKSKRAKLNSSPPGSRGGVDPDRMSELKKLQKKLSLLKNCCSKNQKYNVLVTVVHPCHIKEIQMKTKPKSSCKVPVATIVVMDQSEIERKVVLWRGAAFWSLTVFPGDIILLTDVIMYENHWCGEVMLQSTFTSQLLNLGNCSALSPEEFYPLVDGGVLHGLLAYISSEFPHFRNIPQRQVQRLNDVQYVQLDQLQPNTLVHSVLKIINISVLTESVYSYRGGNQRKIILTVEQNRDQHYRMVLWGAGAAWYPQLQQKKDHLWDFKYLLVQRSSVSGDLELHTTPWSSYECLFDDDKRAVDFKEKFQKNRTSLKELTRLSAHLEEKCSGVIRVKAHILELKFTISTGQYKQIIFSSDTSLECVLASLPMITYSGCAKCGLELQADENMIYKQCIRCLPYSQVKTFYRPALMTVEDEGYEIYVHVVSELVEKIFLNIPADWLKRLVVPSSDLTYSTIVADLCHSLLADTEASYVLEIRSHFVLDENSYPLQKDFHLLNFHPDL